MIDEDVTEAVAEIFKNAEEKKGHAGSYDKLMALIYGDKD